MEQSSSLLLKFAQPQWFVPFFIVLWLVASAVMARVGGWRSLSQQFAAASVPSGQSFRFVSGATGSTHWPIRYRNCLRVVLAKEGLYVAVMFPFSFQSPALQVPWSAFEAVTEKQLFTNRTVTFKVRGHWSAITLSGPLGQLAKAAYEQSRGPQ